MQHKIVFITGATSGIGATFAKKFASQGYNLIITGRREEKIKSLAHELIAKHNINVEVIIAELANDDDLELLVKKIKTTNNLEILINNAGFAKRAHFCEENFTTWENMLKVHALATMKLTHAALPGMIANQKGSIINVSSTMAYGPFPFLPPMHTIYTSTKAFINSFTETINLELKGTNIRVQALCPGLTITDFHERMGLNPKEIYQAKGIFKPMSAEKVVEISLKYLAKNKIICVPGFSNKLIKFLYALKKAF